MSSRRSPQSDSRLPAGSGAAAGQPRSGAVSAPPAPAPDGPTGGRRPGLCCRIDGGGEAHLVQQGTRAWETDGGALPGPRFPVAAPAPDTGLDVMVETVAEDGGTRVEIVLRGELDLQTASQLRAAAADACRPRGGGGARVLVLDLTDVTFMDSAALHALGAIDAEAVQQGWSLRVNPPAGRAPRRLLQLAAYRRWLPMWPTAA